MKTLKRVAVAFQFIEQMPAHEDMEEQMIYIHKEYKCAIHKCLCGCGAPTVMPTHPVHGWEYTVKDDKISFTPSVGNFNFPCKSHYIITNGIANFV